MKFSDKANIAKTFLLGGIVLTSLYNCSSDSNTADPEPVVYSKYISEVLDYMPAPGQFTNDLPKYNAGDTKKDMVQKANDAIAKGANGMIHLGGFGGYVTFRFDHTVANGEGADFKILGNTFTGSSEPGIIMVALDRNKNGKPDDDEWYEIAGSEYFKDTTIKNYSITYYKPDESKTPVKGSANWQTDTEYIRWEDNQGGKGYLTKNSFHKQSYYPMWLGESSITFKGTKIADNFKQNNGLWSSVPFEFGYADNATNESDASNIDISWAVDKNGKYVKLPGIDFVKVYSAIRQENGMLGEVSTEVTGAYDLRIK